MVLDGGVTIGIAGSLDEVIVGIAHIAVGTVDMIPVAAFDHPLALAGRKRPALCAITSNSCRPTTRRSPRVVT
jgi:hypothetical protein